MKKSIVKILSIICAAVISITVIICAVCVLRWKKSGDFVKFDPQKLNEVYSSVTILCNDGSRLAEPLYLGEYKQVPLENLHDYTYMAFVAIEDKRFFKHDGIDYKRIVSAMLRNLKSRSYKEGASTISQQLIKNTHLNNDKTLSRKLNELFLAKELEKRYGKKEILEMYLNTIYFGRNAYGIETAANVYFNKSAQELSVSESATLAGIIKAPNTYAPDKNEEKCLQRRNSVLKLMKEQQIIDDEQYATAVNSQISYEPQTLQGEKTYGYYVLKEACRLLNMSQMQLAQSGFIIETYCNQQLQKKLSDLAKQDVTCNKDGSLADLSCIIANKDGGVEACYFRGESCGTKRQTGSALKPIAVYAPALNERIISEASPVLDDETDFNGYKPTNASGYNGWTTIKYAVAKSLNVPAVKTLNALGLEKSSEYLKKFGISGNQNLSLALGNADGGIDIFTLTDCYCALANNGERNGLGYIDKIYGQNGIIYSRAPLKNRVFQPAANYLMTDMLLNTVDNGTAKNLKSGFQVAAKTGTVGNSDGNSDALVAGYTTKHAFVTWYSGDLQNNVSGATAPCKFSRKVLNALYSNDKPNNFVQPQGVVNLTVDNESLFNKQLVLLSKQGEVYAFDEKYRPTEYVETKKVDYTVECSIYKNLARLSLPNIERGEWRLIRTEKGKTSMAALNNNRYEECISSDLEFYGELLVEGQVSYVTPIIKVNYVSEYDDVSEQKSPPSIFDLWYPK